MVWGLVWLGLCRFCVFACSILHSVFPLGIIVWDFHVVTPEVVGLRLVWLGLWLVLLGFLSNNMFSNNELIYQSLYKYVT